MKYPIDTSNRPRLMIIGINHKGMAFEDVPEPSNYYCWLYEQYSNYRKLIYGGGKNNARNNPRQRLPICQKCLN